MASVTTQRLVTYSLTLMMSVFAGIISSAYATTDISHHHPELSPHLAKRTPKTVPYGESPAHDRGDSDAKAYAWSDESVPFEDRSFGYPFLFKDDTILLLEPIMHLHGVSLRGGGTDEEQHPDPQIKRYDPVHRVWSDVPYLIDEQDIEYYIPIALANGKVLAMSDTCQLYDATTNSWKKTNGSISPYYCLAASLADSRVLVAPTMNRHDFNSFIYDSEKGTCTNIPQSNLPPPDKDKTSLILLKNGKMLFSGGKTCEIFDPATSTWSLTGSMVTARTYHTATVLDDGRVLITGGMLPGHTLTPTLEYVWLTSCEIYDPQTGIWSATASLPQWSVDAKFHRIEYAVVKLLSGHVMVIGGRFAENNKALDHCDEYDPKTGLWSAAPPLTHARGGHSANVLHDGRIVVIGDHYLPLPVEIYAPVK